MDWAIEISGVTVYYDHICALKDIHFRVRDRELVAVLGPNGGGKSTLLRVILGLIKPVTGSVRVFGAPPGGQAVGYVPQLSAFDRRFPISVCDAVLTGALAGRTGLFLRHTEDERALCAMTMERLEIDDLAERQIGQLSNGQVQRVLIARALMMRPRILLLDEPAASLDASAKSHIFSMIRDLKEEMTVIMVTHDMMAVSAHVDNIACLNTSLYYHGEPELSREVLEKVYGCPVELIAHGVPHRVLGEHGEGDHV
jgi:zinc transport system ATP-binding protein